MSSTSAWMSASMSASCRPRPRCAPKPSLAEVFRQVFSSRINQRCCVLHVDASMKAFTSFDGLGDAPREAVAVAVLASAGQASALPSVLHAAVFDSL